MRFKKTLCLILTVLFSLGLTSAGFAYQMNVEIVPVGEYPDSALPPGEISTLIELEGQADFVSWANLEAVAYPGWLFLGWLFDESFYEKHELPVIEKVAEPSNTRWTAQRFIIHHDIDAKAVFGYVGTNPVFDELNMLNPGAPLPGDDKALYNVGAYVRDSKGRDGDFGTIFCYPYGCSKDLLIQDGATILLAAIAKKGFQFRRWDVYKKGENGKWSQFDQSVSVVIILNIDGSYSIDVIFGPCE